MGWEMLPPEQPVWVSRCCPDECVKKRDELQRHCESYKSAYDAILADLRTMEQKLNDLQVENARLIRLGEERHIRAKDTEEGLMEHVERLQAENERLLRCLADYPAGNQTEPDVKAALREVDGVSKNIQK